MVNYLGYMTNSNSKTSFHCPKEPIPFARWAATFASMVSKIHPVADGGPEDVLLAQELKRLALLSPHLLSDIGLISEQPSESSVFPLDNRDDETVVVKVEGAKCSVLISNSQVNRWSKT